MLLKGETLRFYVSFYVSMFHFLFLQRFKKNIMVEKSKHARRKFRTCSERLQNMLEEMRLKH